MALLPTLEIDLSLTPENAKERGYSYLFDIFDGMVNSSLTKSMIEDEGYKLGKAQNQSYVVSAGVYEPIGNRTQEQDTQQAI